MSVSDDFANKRSLVSLSVFFLLLVLVGSCFETGKVVVFMWLIFRILSLDFFYGPKATVLKDGKIYSILFLFHLFFSLSLISCSQFYPQKGPVQVSPLYCMS